MASEYMAESRTVALSALNQEAGESASSDGFREPGGLRQEFSLSPVDRGKDAYLFLTAAFTLEALVWGFPFTFGVFQEYYTKHEPFAGSSSIAVIGTCAMVCDYLIC